MIEEAKRFVHLEYFIFRKDSVGRILLNILSEKALEGVEVRLLIDAYGNRKAPCPMTRADLDSIRAKGIDVRLFDPIKFPYIQNMYHRDHRKIVVVDGLWAWTGGMNVA
ncbi:MAG: cardiolipin synthase, partial [Bacteroidaceae bacterium]|nr:cardiolipin synthase [Bacteroidaceae bacterium]